MQHMLNYESESVSHGELDADRHESRISNELSANSVQDLTDFL